MEFIILNTCTFVFDFRIVFGSIETPTNRNMYYAVQILYRYGLYMMLAALSAGRREAARRFQEIAAANLHWEQR